MEAKTTESGAVRPRKSRLAVASITFAFLGWIGLFWLFGPWGPWWFIECSLLCIPLCWLMSLTAGIAALIRIKRTKGVLAGKIAATAGICISAVSLIVVFSYSIWMAGRVFKSPPFRECDPGAIVGLIEKSFDFKFPEQMESVRAAEVEDTWLEHTYTFILNFTTDQKGFAKLQNSLPKRRAWEQYDTREYDPRTNYVFPNVPAWHKTEMKECRVYPRSIYSRNKVLQIDSICADTGDPQNVVVYIEGWGNYFPGYDLRYINPENPNVVPDNPKAVRWLLKRFAEIMKVEFPADTTLINAKQLCALYGQAYVKVKIGRASLRQFIKSSPFSDKPLRNDKRFCKNEPELPWWDPEKPKIFKSGETQLSNIYRLRILIDLDDPNAAVTYLEWLEV